MLRLVKVPQAPPKRLSLILEFEIGELTKRSTEPTCGAYHISGASEMLSDQLLATIALVKKKTTEQIYQNLHGAGVACHAFLPTPFALYNTFLALKNYDPSGVTVLLDIGVQTTTLAVVKDGAFILGRTIPVGAQELTKALASALSITSQQAENVLLREGVIKPKNWRSEREKSISDALSGVVDRILLGVRSALNMVKRQMRLKSIKPDRVLLFGGCARLPGLDHMVSASLKTKAEVAKYQYEKRAVKEELTGAEDAVKLEVKKAYLALMVAQRNIETARESLKQAKENYRITNLQYQQQITTSTEVLDARTLLTQAETNYFGALYGYNTALAELTRAMGRK